MASRCDLPPQNRGKSISGISETRAKSLLDLRRIDLHENLFFNMVSEMMGDEVMTTAMLDRLLHHAHIYPMDGDSYRVTKTQTEEEILPVSG